MTKPTPSEPPRRWWWVVIAALILAYSLLSQYSASSPDNRALGALLSLGPIIVIGLILLWRWTPTLVASVSTLLVGALLFHYWSAIEQNYEWSDLAQQCGAYALVAASFARSLFGGRVPLCTQLASKMHGHLTPAEIVYTRGATWAWTFFYAMLAIAILALFFMTPLHVWSLFVNFGTFALIIIVGITDHLIRRRVIPRHSDGGLLSVIRRALVG